MARESSNEEQRGHFFFSYKRLLSLYYDGLTNNMFFFFSDARNMARDVHNLLVTIVKENGGMTENEAADYVKKLSAKGRYSVDVWS